MNKNTEALERVIAASGDRPISRQTMILVEQANALHAKRENDPMLQHVRDWRDWEEHRKSSPVYRMCQEIRSHMAQTQALRDRMGIPVRLPPLPSMRTSTTPLITTPKRGQF